MRLAELVLFFPHIPRGVNYILYVNNVYVEVYALYIL